VKLELLRRTSGKHGACWGASKGLTEPLWQTLFKNATLSVWSEADDGTVAMCLIGLFLLSSVKEEGMTRGERPHTRHRPLSDQAYVSIKNAIITAQLEPDHRLIEEAIAADMGASRTPVREALQKLEKEGLIFRLPKRGFAVKGVTEEEVEDILDLQCTLEGYAARLATSRITGDEIGSLNELIHHQEDCLKNLDAETFIRLDGEFHDAIHRAAKNARLYDLVQGLRDAIDRYRVIVFRSHAKLHLSVKDHKEMVSLMQTGNVRRIEKLISRHIIEGKNIIKKRIRRQREAR
jgi:DNA-binding GntR family transcriptional regulator